MYSNRLTQPKYTDQFWLMFCRNHSKIDTSINITWACNVWLVWFMVFNATFNNISIIPVSWRSVLLVEEIGITWQTVSHTVVSSTPRHEWDTNSTWVVIDTDCTGSCKSNYHAYDHDNDGPCVMFGYSSIIYWKGKNYYRKIQIYTTLHNVTVNLCSHNPYQ